MPISIADEDKDVKQKEPKQFDPNKLYLNTFNFNKEPPVPGSTLNAHNIQPDHTWLEVTAQDEETITILHPKLPKPLALQRGGSAHLQINIAIGKSKPKTKTKKRRRSRSRSGRPSKKVNYAAQVLSMPFDAGMRATAKRMDELKEENGELPAANVRQIPFYRSGKLVTMIEVA